MITEDHVLKWMRERIAEGHFDTAASLSREFLEAHNIHDVLDPDFSRVINVGFRLAPEIADCLDKQTSLQPCGAKNGLRSTTHWIPGVVNP